MEIAYEKWGMGMDVVDGAGSAVFAPSKTLINILKLRELLNFYRFFVKKA